MQFRLLNALNKPNVLVNYEEYDIINARQLRRMPKKACTGGGKMYQIREKKQPALDFELPFPGDLEPDNRWAVLSEKIPWDALEQEHKDWVDVKSESGVITFRMAFGTLIIQKKLKFSDAETLELIMENIYLQYFIGLHKFIIKKPFCLSDMNYFRENISPELVSQIDKKYPLSKRKAEKND